MQLKRVIWKYFSRIIINNVNEKNPKNWIENDPLQYAIERGHLEICTYIMDHLQNKNPKDNDDWTPLHFAAYAGHFDICNAMTKIVDDKNPICNNGMTPRELLQRKVDEISWD